MVMNARIADLIREGRADEITDAVAEGDFFQMQTFTQALIEHVLSGKVDAEIAANAATNRHDFLVSLEQAAKRQRADQAAEAEAATAAAAAADVAAQTDGQPQPHQPAEEGFGLRMAPTG
jgi:Tfp pilus assembly ATPase PilU